MTAKEKSAGYLVAGVLISILGAICFSTKAIFVKLAYATASVDAVTLLALRMIFSLPFFIVSAVVSSNRNHNVRFTNKQWIHVALLGICGYYISSLLDFEGLKFVSAGIERLILFIYPTFVLLLSALWFGRKVKTYEWIAVAVTYTGLLIAFLSEAQLQTDQSFYFGSSLILVCAVTYALYIAGSGALIPALGAIKFNSYAMSFAAGAVLLHYFLFGSHSLIGLPSEVYGFSFAMALISTVIPSYLVAISIRRLGSNTTAIIASIGPVSTIFQAWWVLNEGVSAMEIAGTVFILAGILLISWKRTELRDVSSQ